MSPFAGCGHGPVVPPPPRPGARRRAAAEGGACSPCRSLGLQFPPREEQTPEALGAFQKAEIDKWWPIIKAAGIKAQ
jgi:hypothetical protein